MEDKASNYNRYAEVDDGSCEYLVLSSLMHNWMMVPVNMRDVFTKMHNYDENATIDDSSCDFSDILLRQITILRLMKMIQQ